MMLTPEEEKAINLIDELLIKEFMKVFAKECKEYADIQKALDEKKDRM